MPGLGRGFINVLDRREPDNPGSMQWAEGDSVNDDRRGIQDAIYSLVDPSSPDRLLWRGGIVYFPPGTYVLYPRTPGVPGRREEFYGVEDLYIPRDVQLMFAPGAAFLFERDGDRSIYPVINIEGEINAGPQKIFETLETFSLSSFRALRPQISNIFFTGTQVTEIFPEWWGAGSLPRAGRVRTGADLPMDLSVVRALIDTYALQAALDAACNFRQWDPVTGMREQAITGFSRPTIPIRLGGSYQLAAPLRVGGRVSASGVGTVAPNSTGLILRGVACLGSSGIGVATLIWNNFLDFPEDALAMLELRGMYGVEISNIIMDAQTRGSELRLSRRAKRCVFLDAQPVVAPSPTAIPGSSQGTVFRRCTFRNATESLIQVGPALPPFGDPRWDVFPRVLRIDNFNRDGGGHDLLNLSFEQCVFHAGGASVDTSFGTDQSFIADGVVLRAANSLVVRFDGGLFSGSVRAMIRVYGGSFSLTGCSFHCQPIVRGGIPEMDPPAVYPETDFERGSGADVFLALPPQEHNIDTGNFFSIPTAGFVAVQCDSQSYQFLLTHRRRNTGGNPYNVALVNVHHATVLDRRLQPNPDPLGLIPQYPPSIEWLGPGRENARLTMDGCHFSNDGIRVLIGPDLPPCSVLSMGTRDAGGRTWIYGSAYGELAFAPYTRGVVKVAEYAASTFWFIGLR